MTIERVIQILTPCGVAKSPKEYEVARRVAVAAVKLAGSSAYGRVALEEALADAEEAVRNDNA